MWNQEEDNMHLSDLFLWFKTRAVHETIFLIFDIFCRVAAANLKANVSHQRDIQRGKESVCKSLFPCLKYRIWYIICTTLIQTESEEISKSDHVTH